MIASRAHWLRNRTLQLLLGALLLGAATYWLAQQYLLGREQQTVLQLRGQYRTASVVVAKQAIPAGTHLQADLLATRAIPERYLPGDSIPAAGAATVLGRRTVRALAAGEALVMTALEAREAAGLSARVAAGARALTIVVDEVSSASGLVKPGDLIDLLFLPAVDGENAIAHSILPLLQAVRVVATGRQVQRRRTAAPDGTVQEQDAEYGTITLHVAPADAARVALAQRAGEVTAVLRATEDSAPVNWPRLQVRDLTGVPTVATTGRPPRLAEWPLGTEIIYGGRGVSL